MFSERLDLLFSFYKRYRVPPSSGDFGLPFRIRDYTPVSIHINNYHYVTGDVVPFRDIISLKLSRIKTISKRKIIATTK